jgi:hypothetical protein
VLDPLVAWAGTTEVLTPSEQEREAPTRDTPPTLPPLAESWVTVASEIATGPSPKRWGLTLAALSSSRPEGGVEAP